MALNLISNAISNTYEGSVKVKVEFYKRTSTLKLIVEDTGIGIKDEDHDKIFKMISTNKFQHV